MNIEPTVLHIISPSRWDTFNAFNGNCYPVDLRPDAESCSTRLAHFAIAVDNIKRQLSIDKEIFIHELQKPGNICEIAGKHPDIIFVTIYDGIEYEAAMHGALNSLKSFLDVYARLMGKLIQRDVIWSFKRRKISGQEIAGGTIINWLTRSAPTSFQNASQLAAVIEAHSKGWITDAIKYRDTLYHYGEIKRLRHMHVRLTKMKPYFDPATIVLPLMPNGQPITDYFDDLRTSLKTFICETLGLLPSIDWSDIQPEKLFSEL